MPQRTIVMLRLDLQGFLWRALLNETLPDLENYHLGIRAAREGKPYETRLLGELPALCEYLTQFDGGAAVVVNLRFGPKLDRDGSCLLSLVESGAALFIHSRDSEFMLGNIGRELAGRSRTYEASPVAPGKRPSEKQQAWLDVLGRLGIERPRCTLASLAHDFMGKIGSLQLALHSMERPDGNRLVLELRKSIGGLEKDVDAFFEDLQNIYDYLEEQLAVRLETAEISQEDREKVEFWSERAGDLMDKLGILAQGDHQAGADIENSLMTLRQSLNNSGSVRL
jgi:hypothetical protein